MKRVFSKEHRRKLSEAKRGKKRPQSVVDVLKNRTGKKNPAWKGEDVGYTQLHRWVKKQLEKPTKCPECGRSNYRIELANKTGIYNRELKNWFWLCQMCHHKYDGIESPSFEGRKHTKLTKQKMSKSSKKRGRNKKGRFI